MNGEAHTEKQNWIIVVEICFTHVPYPIVLQAGSNLHRVDFIAAIIAFLIDDLVEFWLAHDGLPFDPMEVYKNWFTHCP